MLRSSTIRSGLKCLACSMAFAPSSASSQTSIPADSKMMRRLRRTSGLSSTKKTHLGMSLPDDQQSLEGGSDVRRCPSAAKSVPTPISNRDSSTSLFSEPLERRSHLLWPAVLPHYQKFQPIAANAGKLPLLLSSFCSEAFHDQFPAMPLETDSAIPDISWRP